MGFCVGFCVFLMSWMKIIDWKVICEAWVGLLEITFCHFIFKSNPFTITQSLIIFVKDIKQKKLHLTKTRISRMRMKTEVCLLPLGGTVEAICFFSFSVASNLHISHLIRYALFVWCVELLSIAFRLSFIYLFLFICN